MPVRKPQLFNDSRMTAALESAALDSDGWMPVIDLLMARFNGEAGGINTVDLTTGRAIAAGHNGMTAKTEAEYYTYLIRSDPRLAILGASSNGTVFSDAALLADPAIANSEYYAWEADQGFRHTLVFKLFHTPVEMSAIAITRRKGRGAHDDAALAVAGALAPRLAGAAAINRRIAALNGLTAGLERALTAGARAFALFGPGGLMIEANAAFHAALDRRDGLGGEALALAAFSVAVEGRPRALQVKRPDGKPAYRLVLQPVSARAAEVRRFDWGRRGAVLAFLDDPDAGATGNRAPVLQQMFGLTAAEARVAVLIADGEDVEAIARRQGIAIATVRTQLKSIFGKLGVSRQLGVARLVRGLPQFDA